PPPPDLLFPAHQSPEPMAVDKDPNSAPEAEFTDASEHYYWMYHSLLNRRPCTSDGVFLVPGMPPTLLPPKSPNDWSLYRNDIEFSMVEFVFK
ncbi:uncharacterized protein HD556DRAFT_1208062, partial [Suillus plorans]